MLPIALPILSKKEEILRAVRENPVVVILGPTGSGKTTQTPLFLYEAGYGETGVIGVTEPRRIAATSLTSYVGTLLPEEERKAVGGQTRFWNTTTDDTKIKFMTDGILLEEMLHDPELLRYSVIMIDEAHERGINVDLILGLLKCIKSRPDFRIIIASATIDATKFSEFFGGAPIVEIEGFMYPVEVHYAENPHFGEHARYREAPKEVAQKVLEIARSGEEGDILAFLPGKNEIAEAMDILHAKGGDGLKVLPAYGHMDLLEQNAIFEEYPGKRKVIIATNVAETSITPVGVKFIVDSGLIKKMSYHAKYGRHSLEVSPHSKSGCDQRKGRAGRTQAGVCHRLYTEEEFEALPLYTEPEILRMSLAEVVLTMRYIGIHDVEHFEFIDKPKRGLFREAVETLKMFGALDENESLTEYGKRMALLPLDAYLSHMLLTAEKHGCIEEIATVASFISASNTMLRPPEQEKESDAAHKKFESELSDALTYLAVWDEYLKHEGDAEWFAANFLNETALQEVKDIRTQLLEMIAEFGIGVSTSRDPKRVLKAIAESLIHHLFRRKDKGNAYYPMTKNDGDPAFIHPGSSTYEARPSFIVCAEIVRTTKAFARMCSYVEEEWIKKILHGRVSDARSVVVGYNPDRHVAYVKKIALSARKDGQGAVTTVKVNEREASFIQEKNIEAAKKDNCVLVRFCRRPGNKGELYAVYQGREYAPASRDGIEIRQGAAYYASLKTEKRGGRIEMIAEVRFQVFDFPNARGEDDRKPKTHPKKIHSHAKKYRHLYEKKS